MKVHIVLFLLLFPILVHGTNKEYFNYRVETVSLLGGGKYAPLWLTANKYGKWSDRKIQYQVNADLNYGRIYRNDWKLDLNLDIIGGGKLVSSFWIQQAFISISRKQFKLNLGSKETLGAPLAKNPELSSGWMVEGMNSRPIPQIRIEIDDYVAVPFTHQWISLKGHLAYGFMFDGKWQENFVARNEKFTRDVLYHSKSLMFRFGKKQAFPMEFEFGLITAAQFGGKLFKKESDGSIVLEKKMLGGFKDFFSVLIPKQKSSYENISGNHCGSWNLALNTFAGDWKFRMYYEHYFEDHSQMFWQYGRWKDGQLGFSINLPSNHWISSVVWEIMSTKDQTKSVLYDGVAGSFPDFQMSGDDNYFNNGEYLAWQYYGQCLGHPFFIGPLYDKSRSNRIKSSRIRFSHLGLSGHPTQEWSWRMLASFVRHWGTYRYPLDKQRKQFNSLFEVSYEPLKLGGCKFSLSVGLDRGNYLGNNTGVMFSISKKGFILL